MPALRLSQRLILLAAGGLAFATWLFPTPLLREQVRTWAGRPAWEGPWIVAEHALLYTTLCAAACAGAWWLLHRYGLLEERLVDVLRVRPLGRTLGWGVGFGLLIFAFTCAGLFALHALGAVPDPPALVPRALDGWVVLGNVFSNFYEELIYRGFLFAVAAAATGSRGAAVALTSVLFGLTHPQYPVAMQALIAGGAALACIPRLKTGSIIPLWLAHMGANVLADALL